MEDFEKKVKKQPTLMGWLKSNSTPVSNMEIVQNQFQKSCTVDDESGEVEANEAEVTHTQKKQKLCDDEIKNRKQSGGETKKNTSSIEKVSTNKPFTGAKAKDNPCFEQFRFNGDNYVRCTHCIKNQSTVQLNNNRARLPPIATDAGTRVRESTLQDHLQSTMHIEASKAFAYTQLSVPEKMESTAIGIALSEAQLMLANHIGKLMIHVYSSAKSLTSSAHNFLTRVVTGLMAENFDFKEKKEVQCNFQYVTPNSFREILEIIVDCHRLSMLEEFRNSLAVSLRCDGSVDRTQTDKIYTMAKLVDQTGNEKLRFLRAAEPDCRGAKGLFGAVTKGCESTLKDTFDRLLKLTSSLVTDGASVNTGEKSGLWALFDEYIEKLKKKALEDGVEFVLSPLLKIWCGGHRSELSMTKTTETVSELKKLIREMVAISSYFHKSGLRTKELNDIAKEKKLHLVTLPTYFEIRWTEFTYNLCSSVLRSYQALCYYFEKFKGSDAEANGFYKLLTNESNVRLLCFVTDVLEVFSRFQKSLQSVSVTILDMIEYKNQVCEKLKALRETPLLGGWVSILAKELNVSKNSRSGQPVIKLKNFVLHKKRRSRDIDAIKNEIILSLSNFLYDRFSNNENNVDVLKPFTLFEQDADLEKIHECIASDLNLTSLDLEYSEIVKLKVVELLKTQTLQEKLKTLISLKKYPILVTIFSRIVAAKPNSADVERLISSDNILKSADRSRMNVSTENLYLYIYYNMPSLDNWDSRPAVQKWINMKNRRKKDCSKAKAQTYYKGIFHEASAKEKEEENQITKDNSKYF